MKDYQQQTQMTDPVRPRFLGEAECHDIVQRLSRFSTGGGSTAAHVISTWKGNVRWARNQVSTSGEIRDDHILVSRDIDGLKNLWVEINDSSDAALVAAVRRAERLAYLLNQPQIHEDALVEHLEAEPFDSPKIFSETTYQLDAETRASVARQLVQSAVDAGMLSAGYIEVAAHSQAYITSYGYARYFQYTAARYSVTVRDPKGVGSGWAGMDWYDWQKIDGPKLSQLALEKCIQSRNPVGIEPGRYTTILEPQAVGDFIGLFTTGKWWGDIQYQALDFYLNTHGGADAPFFSRVDQNDQTIGYAKLGQRICDQRITITSNPMDPELGFPPFQSVKSLDDTLDPYVDVYHPVTWVENGILKNLAYDRPFALSVMGKNLGQPRQGAMRMSGGETSIAEMIETTKRGLLVTRFSDVEEDRSGGGGASLLCSGYTRDGLWLIENGKIAKAVKNLRFTESIIFALNNIEQLGVPQRVFHPMGDWWFQQPQPMVMPPLKIRDFSFTALSNAI